MDTAGGRRRGKPRTRILYWFRTPPGVRVGRSALDEEAIRLIEQHNPDVEFDWTRILKGQEQAPPPAPAPHKERRVRERPPREPMRPPAPRPAPPAAAAPPPPPLEIEERAERDVEGEDAAVRENQPSTVAEVRLGAEGLARLRARHAAVLARISEGITDPVRRDELKAQAERLNPDTWVTAEEVTAGIESYEAVFESIRTAVGRRRKRRRPRGPRPDQAQQGTVPDGPDEETDDETPEPEAG